MPHYLPEARISGSRSGLRSFISQVYVNVLLRYPGAMVWISSVPSSSGVRRLRSIGRGENGMDTTRIRDVFQGARVEKQKICGHRARSGSQCQCIGGSTIGWHPSVQPHTAAAQNDRASLHFSPAIDVLSAHRVLLATHLLIEITIRPLAVTLLMSPSQTMEQHAGEESEVCPGSPATESMQNSLSIELEPLHCTVSQRAH
jgi:hypothetical protein